MEFFQLVQSVQELDVASFAKQYSHPFLVEEPEEQGAGAVPAPWRVFQVARRDKSEGAVIVGRAATADVPIEERSVSSRHAALKHSPSGWTITDLHSSNGTRVGDTPVPPAIPMPITSGSRIRFGVEKVLTFLDAVEIHGRLRKLGPVLQENAAAMTTDGEVTIQLNLPAPAVEAPRARPPKVDLATKEIVARCEQTPSLTLTVGREFTIGRTVENDMVLSNPLVSRRHAALLLSPDGGVVVRDLGSANGICVGEKRVNGEAGVDVGGDPVVIGPYQIRIVAVSSASEPKLPEESTMVLRKSIYGRLEMTSLADMLNASKIGGRSGILEIATANDGRGEIVFNAGTLVRATFGGADGDAAIEKMLAVKEGQFKYTPTSVD
jgi:pSer/pThr/pTyr-binding forkhead associated (FHA) protein